MKLFFLIATLLVALAAASIAVASQPQTLNWTIDGVKREALVYSPAPTTSNIKHPLVFGFHGHGGTMQGAAQMMHVQTLWPEAIVVYPQGIPGRPTPVDPNGNKPGWQVEANQANVGNADLEFFDAMVATMHQKFSVDDKRVYSTGFSNGGIFSYLLWAERAKTLAAIGECAGVLWNSEQLTQPRAFLAIAGTQDKTAPFNLQKASIEKAQNVDSAPNPGQPCPQPSGSAPGTKCTFYPSTTQTPVKTLIHPGAHVYPSWAPAEIVTFFKNHKRL
ncbi:MAG: esterase [Acidobacteriota bacterium]